ncbi:hypothetical protein [Kitasatospora sp. NPDC088783]|uniref:hypothetical protein n=1 Tax=Kitasatospora sp. NPDC088783 TaxID=3364077 RepID=UPI003800D9B3
MILARQFRPCPQQVPHELPGGFVEPAIDPAGTTAALLEESGYQGTVQPVTGVWDDAHSNAIRHASAADCVKAAEPRPEHSESIDTIPIPLDLFRSEVLRKGPRTDAAAAHPALDHLGPLQPRPAGPTRNPHLTERVHCEEPDRHHRLVHRHPATDAHRHPRPRPGRRQGPPGCAPAPTRS